MIGQLKYNKETRRLELDGDELHSGEPLTVLVINQDDKPEWVDTRLEYSHEHADWYLVGLPEYQASGLFAKID